MSPLPLQATLPDTKNKDNFNAEEQVLKVGCVPEHFSVPLLQCESSSLNIVSMPCGTGQMITALKEGEIEASVSLFEGIIAKAVNERLDLEEKEDNRLCLLGMFTDSPLTWSIAVSPDSCYTHVSQLKTIGISRYGSGSHIMAIVLGMNLGIVFDFVVCGNIKGLLDSVNQGHSDAFLWEVVTTKPYYDEGIVKMLDTLTSPWPAFCFASTVASSTVHTSQLHAFLKKMQSTAIPNFISTFYTKGIDYILSSPTLHYKSKPDLESWFVATRFTKSIPCVSRDQIRKCMDVLVRAKVIDGDKLAEWQQEHDKSIIEEICNPDFVKLV